MKQLLSDLITIIFGESEEGETHSWSVIIGVFVFLAFITFMLKVSTL